MLFSVWQATLPLPLNRNQYGIEMYERDTSGKSLTEAGEAVYWSSIDRHWSQKTQFQTPLFPSLVQRTRNSLRTWCENHATGWSQRPPHFTCYDL